MSRVEEAQCGLWSKLKIPRFTRSVLLLSNPTLHHTEASSFSEADEFLFPLLFFSVWWPIQLDLQIFHVIESPKNIADENLFRFKSFIKVTSFSYLEQLVENLHHLSEYSKANTPYHVNKSEKLYTFLGVWETNSLHTFINRPILF